MSIWRGLYKIMESVKCGNVKSGFYCNWIDAQWSRMLSLLDIHARPWNWAFVLCFTFTLEKESLITAIVSFSIFFNCTTSWAKHKWSAHFCFYSAFIKSCHSYNPLLYVCSKCRNLQYRYFVRARKNSARIFVVTATLLQFLQFCM